MTKRDLIDTIAREGLVERLVANVCHRRHRALPDLVQMAYEALLKSDGQKLLNLYQRNALNFFYRADYREFILLIDKPLLSADSEVLPNE